MRLDDTPRGERTRICLLGCRNVGKSSLMNALSNQSVSLVSDIAGTTTDPVLKSMELLPLGPVLLVDAPGFDDAGALGARRVERAREELEKADIVLLVVDIAQGFDAHIDELLALIREKNKPYLIVVNKLDIQEESCKQKPQDSVSVQESLERLYPGTTMRDRCVAVSALTGEGIENLKARIAQVGSSTHDSSRELVGDLVSPGDIVLLVMPLDEAAPKGRIILPQQLVIRALLETHAIPICTQAQDISTALASLAQPPSLVITDSQVFKEAALALPSEIPLTSFSILMIRYKGDLDLLVRGAAAIDTLRDGDRILVAEACTHHRQCKDIGTVKIPTLLKQATGKQLHFESSSGEDFPSNVSDYALVIHCGACMINRSQVASRLARAVSQSVPITNYGMAIAKATGILNRALAPLNYKVASSGDYAKEKPEELIP